MQRTQPIYMGLNLLIAEQIAYNLDFKQVNAHPTRTDLRHLRESSCLREL